MKTTTAPIVNKALGQSLVDYTAKLLTIRELAKRLRKTEKTIWRWQKLGRLPHLKIGHTVLYPEADVMAHLRAKFGRNLN
jgi:excisionase family DNA binding protein